MSLHNFNPNNKSWKMYSNTITSISGDNLTIKPYDGKNLLLEVSGNNNIFFKKGDISYGLDDLIDTNITLTSVSGDIIPSNDNTFKLGDVSKNWSNAYIRDLSVSNISVSENFILNISGSMTNITDIFNNLGNTFDTIGTSIYNIEYNVIDLSNNKAPLANPSFTGTVVLPADTINSSHIIDGTILGTDISSGTITATNIANETITKFQIAPNAITNDKIASSAVLAIHIGNGVVNSSHIQNGTILGEDISAGTINLSNLSASAISSLTTVTIPANSINSSHIQNGTILTEDISNNSITVDKLALGSVIGNRIVNGSITTDKIDFYQVTGNRMANNTITTTQLDASINTILNNVSLKANIANPTFTGTVGGITKSMVGLGNVDNTSDLLKPISTATQGALNLLAPRANPTFTGTANLPATIIAGHCIPSINNTYLLGGSSYFWNAIYGVTLHFFFTVVYSDDRLKHNEAIIINGLDIIDKLTPKFYQKTLEMLDADYNGDLSANTWNYEAGLIAQEVLKIPDLSFCVRGGDHYDESNNLIKEPYGVNYNNIFVYGLAAIKELHTKVKAQETIINSLIARIEVLEKFK